MGILLSKISSRKAKIKVKKSVILPAETWLQVIAWIGRMKLGTATSFVSRRFCRIVHVRLHEKCALFPQNNTRKMRRLKITDEEGAHNLPKCPLPDNIVSFHEITINYSDSNVLDFFERILKPLLAQALTIQMGALELRPPQGIILNQRVFPLCTGANFSFSFWLEDFAVILDQFPHLLAKCQELCVGCYAQKDLIEMPKLIKWLTGAREGGQPNLLIMNDYYYWREDVYSNGQIAQIKENFLSSTVPTSFLVRMRKNVKGRNLVEFTAQNLRTREQLSLKLYKNDDASKCYALITRCEIRGAIPNQADQSIIEIGKQKLLNDKVQTPLLSFFVHKIGNLDGNDE